MKIRCYCLFNITRTGYHTRREPQGIDEDDLPKWYAEKNKQINYETILQVVNMRAQPEEITEPTQITIDLQDDRWGYVYQKQQETAPCWQFDFDILQGSVFNDGIAELGSLFKDCSDVPMITNLGEMPNLPLRIDTTDEQRNIYFEVVYEEDNQETNSQS